MTAIFCESAVVENCTLRESGEEWGVRKIGAGTRRDRVKTKVPGQRVAGPGTFVFLQMFSGLRQWPGLRRRGDAHDRCVGEREPGGRGFRDCLLPALRRDGPCPGGRG